MAANTTTGRRAPTASDIFIFDENDGAIGHPDAHRLGLDLKGWAGTHANGHTHPETVRRLRDKGMRPNTRHLQRS